MNTTTDFFLTLDVDWAPDYVIDYVAEILIAHKVKTTWFITHESDAIHRLSKNSELFELGIHPNMLNGSTHGKTEDEVLKHIKAIVPDAVSMRTHGLYQSSNFLIKAAKEYGILYDVSLFLPKTPCLQPHYIKFDHSLLWRVPYFWEDDSEMFEDDPIWHISDYTQMRGLKVFDFHPIHIALNTEKFERYNALKQIKALKSWDIEFIEEYANKGIGTKNIFLDLVHELTGKGKQIKDIINFTEQI